MKKILIVSASLLLLIFLVQKFELLDAKAENTNDTSISKRSDPLKKKVIGIGGIFFKSKDPQKIKDWYEQHLGMKMNEYGAMFAFRSTDEPDKKGYLQWGPFSEDTKYFQPSEKEFMINYRVADLESLLEELRAGGVEIVDTIETYEYGKFLHIMDPEGNKIELWEPVDSVFTKLYQGTTTH
ncbi:MAG: VOC family protein [candidate division Zixibacteria bacterium]|nr:VOC family protein [candidate division Zixibacteria bacterium]